MSILPNSDSPTVLQACHYTASVSPTTICSFMNHNSTALNIFSSTDTPLSAEDTP